MPTPKNDQTHTQPIRRLLLTNCLSVFDPFVGKVLKGLSTYIIYVHIFGTNMIIHQPRMMTQPC